MRIFEICDDYAWHCLYLDDVTWLLRLMIPLSLTIGLFVYKEVKDIGLSVFQLRTKHMWWYVAYFSVFILLLIWIFLLKYSFIHIQVSFVSTISITLIILWFITFIFSLLHLIRTINIESNTKNNLVNFKSESNKLLLLLKKNENISNSNIQSKKIDKHLSKIIESAIKEYQLLIYKINNNWIDDYEKSFKNYNKLILEFTKEINSVYFPIVCSNENYFIFYKTILRYNVLILRSLNNNETLSNTKDIIDNFKSLSINTLDEDMNEEVSTKEIVNRYVREYYKSFYEIINTLSSKSHNYVRSILYILKTNESASGRDTLYKEKDLLMFLVALLYRAIDQNDMKLLTEITNTILELSKESGYEEVESLAFKNILEAFSESINEDNEVEQNLEEISDEENMRDNLLNDSISLILIIGIIKSIEFGNYGCAGFINKVLIKMMNNDSIEKSLDKIFELIQNNDIAELNTLNFSNDFVNSDMVRELDINFNFSEISIEYCFQKATYLIYTQQEYLIKENLYLKSNTQVIPVNNYILSKEQLSYIKSKLENQHKNYGMIALKKIESNDLNKSDLSFNFLKL